MSIPNKIWFKIAFPQLPQPVSEFWACLVDYLDTVKALPKKFTLSEIAGHPEHLKATRGTPSLVVTPTEIETIIRERELTGFGVNTGFTERGVAFDLQRNWDGNPETTVLGTSFDCWIAPKARASQNWSVLIENLLSRWPSIGAWQYIITYQSWQWDSVKCEFYEPRYGPFPPGYKTFLDLDDPDVATRRTFIDISLNPGRPAPLMPQRFCPINFYPTAEMWLGSHFWQYAKCTKEEALAAGFWLETRETEGYTYFKCWPTAFTRPDGEQGRMQQRLWKLFFKEDCEWPPGSGTICDEPMYGPPELMPGYIPPT
jgi:hypothetical protein